MVPSKVLTRFNNSCELSVNIPPRLSDGGTQLCKHNDVFVACLPLGWVTFNTIRGCVLYKKTVPLVPYRFDLDVRNTFL